jgi:hypothetical protein
MVLAAGWRSLKSGYFLGIPISKPVGLVMETRYSVATNSPFALSEYQTSGLMPFSPTLLARI